MTTLPTTLLTTVGTSLLGNLAREPEGSPLRAALERRDPAALGDALAELPLGHRTTGAEACALVSLVSNGYAPAHVGIELIHSETEDGRLVAGVLARLFRRQGHGPVHTHEVAGLTDDDPERFRTEGLANLASVFASLIREHGPAACAINATGGYKAQIAVAVLLGQELRVPTYYMHERFSEIIAFPPDAVASWLTSE